MVGITADKAREICLQKDQARCLEYLEDRVAWAALSGYRHYDIWFDICTDQYLHALKVLETRGFSVERNERRKGAYNELASIRW